MVDIKICVVIEEGKNTIVEVHKQGEVVFSETYAAVIDEPYIKKYDGITKEDLEQIFART